jgi:Fe2+ or Zn2+ uptake regulation protein
MNLDEAAAERLEESLSMVRCSQCGRVDWLYHLSTPTHHLLHCDDCGHAVLVRRTESEPRQETHDRDTVGYQPAPGPEQL